MKKSPRMLCHRTTAFIFDMDGTLVDNMVWHTQAWVELLADHGRHIDLSEFQSRSGGRKSAEVVRELFGPALSEREVKELVDQKELLYRVLYRPRLRLIKGLRRFLQRAARLWIPMALATAGNPRNIDFILDGLGLRSFFNAIAHGGEVKCGKPAPDLFLLAAQRLGVEADRCVVFEDAPGGIAAAGHGGMRAVGITTMVEASVFSSLPQVIEIAADFSDMSPDQFLV